MAPQTPSAAQQLIGGRRPKAGPADRRRAFGDVWERPGLSPRDRSLITVTALMSLYRTEQLSSHLRRALANGLTPDELAEAITHLAFYAGWPNAISATVALKAILEEQPTTAHAG